MELALTIVAALGALLFIIGYLAFVLAGFRHHFVTGIISVFPVLNIVTIPALWHKVGKKVILSFIGAAIVAGSWFMGADKGINNLVAMLKGDAPQETVIASSSSQSTGTQSTSISNTVKIAPADSGEMASPYLAKQRQLDESRMQGLPPRALYRMSFDDVPVNQIKSLKGRVIQLITNDHELFEGRVNSVSNSSVIIQSGSIANELPLANIKQLRLMVKKAN